MDSRDRRSIAAVLFLLLAGVALLYATGTLYSLNPPDDYDRVTVIAYDADGEELATVDARVADTRKKRYVGLSNTDSLERGEGMLFVHPDEGERGYVMRDMAFPIDIVFADADQRVTAIHHAHVPEDGSPDETYRGTGKWVLEVPRGWTNETGLDEGDRLSIPPAARNASGGLLP